MFQRLNKLGKTKMNAHFTNRLFVFSLKPKNRKCKVRTFRKELKCLHEVNKYIFVQDFEKAENLLSKYTGIFQDSYEILFRRVEVATKRGTLEELIIDLNKLKKNVKNKKILETAIILAKIKTLNTPINNLNKNTEQLLQSQINYDIYGTTGRNFGNHQNVISILANKKIRIERTIDFPDDFIPESELNKEKNISSKKKLFKKENQKIEIESREELLDIALQYETAEPNNYAYHFIAGCALEKCGDLSLAIEKWLAAFSLNSKSISVLTVLSELQYIGILNGLENYSDRLGDLDKYLVYGNFDTHTELYNEFIQSGEYKNAVKSLSTHADWLQKNYGEVPVEIEIICLLCAMQAYKLSGNIPASEACQNEVENMVIACKKSFTDMDKISFIAKICEEYGLKSAAKICYYYILTSKETNVELAAQTASYCVSSNPSESLLECLKVAYKNSKGNPEIRFCMLFCGLKVSQIDVSNYMKSKNKVRILFSENRSDPELLTLLEDLFFIYDSDSEIHYYLAEIYSKNNEIKKAKRHFQSMFLIDYYNTDGILRFVFFLLKIRDFETAKRVAEESLALENITEDQANEMRWGISAALYANKDYQNSCAEIMKAIDNSPWNSSYILLFLKSYLNFKDNSFLKDNVNVLEKIEDFVIRSDNSEAEKNAKTNDVVDAIVSHGKECIKNGFIEYAWSLAKFSLLMSPKVSDDLVSFVARSGAAYNSRIAVQQILLYLKTKETNISFSMIAICVAQIYVHSSNWALVDEWVLIAKNCNTTEEKNVFTKIFELEALSLAVKGTDFKKAQSLLEAAIDSYENAQRIPLDIIILHGYILVFQGHLSQGLEKIQSSMNGASTIQSLYFLIKGLERAGQLDDVTKDSLIKLFNIYPTNTFEQKMVEEIFYTVGTKNTGSPIGLAS